MPSLKEIAREILNHRELGLGRVETIASLGTTTAVVTALATGGRSAQEFVEKWMLRRDTATAADRLRRCTSFTASSGTLTHAGTNYADTTATSESIEIWDVEPRFVDLAINATLHRLKREDREIFPTNGGKYWLSDLTWIEKPSDIVRIAYLPDPVLSRNRHFQKWNAYDSSDNLTADWWTLSGSGATYARSTTQEWQGKPTAAITRSGTNCTLLQTVGLLDTGVSADNLRGEVVTVAGWVWSSVASQIRLRVANGAATTNTDFHTGGSGWELLSTTQTVSATATTLQFGASMEVDGTAYLGECYLIKGSISDSIQRDDYIDREEELGPPERFYNQNENALILPRRGLGAQYVIYSHRGYPQFAGSRILGGTADADSTDAPLIPIATGAIGLIYKYVGDMERAAMWHRKFETLALKHLYERNNKGDGAMLPRSMMTFSAGRYR